MFLKSLHDPDSQHWENLLSTAALHFWGMRPAGGAGLCELEALGQKSFGDLPLTNGIFELVYQVVAGKFIELV